MTLWTLGLACSDTEGRINADPKYLKGVVLTYFSDVRLEQVEAACASLEAAGLVHLYDIDGKKYMVYHDHDDFNPSGIRNQQAQWPAPPSGLCRCLDREKTEIYGVSTPIVTSRSVPDGGDGGAGEGVSAEPSPPMRDPQAYILWQVWCAAHPGYKGSKGEAKFLDYLREAIKEQIPVDALQRELGKASHKYPADAVREAGKKLKAIQKPPDAIREMERKRRQDYQDQVRKERESKALPVADVLADIARLPAK